MSAITRLFGSIRNAATALFRQDITAVRDDNGDLRLSLRAPRRDPRSEREELIRRQQLQELNQVRAELAALLNQLPETRVTMRHLVFVEQALAKRGLRVLHSLPLDVLLRAHEQLEGLVTNWTPVGLANLRSKMAVAIIDREHMDEPEDPVADQPFRTAAVMDAGRPSAPPPEPAALCSDDEALAAAYAALGSLSPVAIEMQSELGSASGRGRDSPERALRAAAPSSIQLRELQD